MPGNHSKKDKLKKRIASIDDDITSKHKKKSKDKNKLIHDAKGFSNMDKIKKRLADREKRLAEKAEIELTPENKQDSRAHITRDQKLMDKIPKEKYTEYKDPQSLAKGVATNYNNPTKVKNRKLKGKVSKLKTRLAGLAYSDKKKNRFPVPKDKAGKPLWNEDDDGNPITKEDRMKRHKHVGTVHYDAAGERVTKKEYESGAPKITDKDVATQLKRTAQEHEHSIHFKGYKGEYYKRASLVSAEGRYAKYWLLNAKQTNGNGWGVSQQSIAKNIHKFVGKPLVVTAKSWVPDSVYGDAYEHPYLPTNDINKVLDHQEKYRVGSIVDIIEKDGDYFANIEINQKFAHMILPPFCSPAIFQNNPSEPEGQISDWEALHLAALHEDPAYGSRIALLRGTCVGTQDQCTVQFKSAKQEAKIVCTKDLKGRLAALKKNDNLKQRIAAVSPTVMNQKDGETIANAYDKMLHDPNNPGVKESYSAFIKETEDQFNELKKNGLRIDPIKPGTNPYQTADDLHNDLKKNNHIYYYPSEEGFGSTDNKFGDHPLLKESNVTYKGKKLLNNDVFRIVHDINGHNLANSDFSPEGEHNAFLSHRKMYSPLAGKALFTETAAQANWGSYNKKSGASNRKLMDQGRVNELVFADQKAGLLPDDIINTEWHTGTSRTGKLKQRLAADEWTDIEDRDFFRKPLNLRPPEYSKEYGMDKMDYIGNLHNESAWNAGQKAMERFDKELSHPHSKRYAYDLMDSHAYDKYLNLVNTDLQDAVEYNDSDTIFQTLDLFDKDVSDSLNYKIEDKFGFGDPAPKPKSEGESLGRALLEPFEKMKDEEYSQIPDRKGDMLRTKKILSDFNKDTSGGMMKLFGRNKNNLQAKLKHRLGRLIKGKQRKAGMSKKVAQIVNSFKQSGFDPTGTSGIWDAQNSKNLNAYEKPDLERIWELYGRRGMGFNSITNTIEGPNKDIGLIAKQLTEIEEEGGIPALGFDNGSLEAVNVTYGTKDEVLDKLLPHQNSTGYIDEDGKLDIPDNPRYEDYLKEIDKK